MPISLSNVAIQQFHDSFINKYQASALLGDTTVTVMGALGDAYKFPIQGSTVMDKRGAYQSIIPASDLSYTPKIVTFDNYVKNIPVDIFQSKELEISALQGLGSVHAKAAGRMEDQTIINAIQAATLPATNVIADGGTNMTVAKLLQASAALTSKNVDRDDRFLVITANQEQALLNQEKTTSNLYVTDRNLMNGRLDNFLGMKIYVIDGREEGGLEATGNIRSCFLWQMESVGRVYSMTPTTDIDWSALHQSWLTIARMRLGATALLENGIVEIKCDESA